MQRMAEDLSQQYDDDTVMYLEQSFFINSLDDCCNRIDTMVYAS